MKKYAALIALMSLPVCVSAEIFETTITVNNIKKNIEETKTFGFDVGQDLFDQFKEKVLTNGFDNYSNSAYVTAQSNFRGLPFTTVFAENSTELTFRVDRLGILKTFKGATRTKSADMLERYLRRNIDGTLSKISKELIATSATDPLAGNVTSLQGQMVFSDFQRGCTSCAAGATRTASGVQVNPFLVGVGGGNYTQDGIDISVINVPISTSFNVDSNDPRKKLLVNGQFNYVAVGNAESYQGGLGIGYLHPINDHWSLTPGLSYGIIGSPDLVSAGQIFSASITSNYGVNVNDYSLSMANMFGYYKTLPLNVGDVDSDPDISNYVLKNGFFVGKNLPYDVLGHKLNLMGFFTDTEFFGSKVFSRQYNEIGFQIGTIEDVAWLKKVSFGMADKISFSAKYIFSIEDSNSLEGYDLGISYQF